MGIFKFMILSEMGEWEKKRGKTKGILNPDIIIIIDNDINAIEDRYTL